METDHKSPWQILQTAQNVKFGFWEEGTGAWDKQLRCWNSQYTPNVAPCLSIVRWAIELTRTVSYPHTDKLAWGVLQDELNFYSLEGYACSPNTFQPPMLLSTALICYTDIYKNLNTQQMCRDAMKRLRKIGINIVWTGTFDEEDQRFAPPARTTRRNTFGKGAIPMLRRVTPVMRACKRAFLPSAKYGENKELWGMITDEVIFQLNTFAEENNFLWRAEKRMDWEELWQIA